MLRVGGLVLVLRFWWSFKVFELLSRRNMIECIVSLVEIMVMKILNKKEKGIGVKLFF